MNMAGTEGDRLCTEAVLRDALPGLRALLPERPERSHGSVTGTPPVDVVLWAEAPGG